MDKSLKQVLVQSISVGDEHLRVTVTRVGESQILSASGYIDLATVGSLEFALGAIGDVRRAIIDFSDVDFLSACAIHAICRAGRRLGKERLTLVTKLDSQVDRLLYLAGAQESCKVCHCLQVALREA